MKKNASILLLLFLGYGTFYLAARWRKVLVMKEYNAKEEGMIRREIGQGWDFRSNWRANLKNEAARPLLIFFKPLVLFENCARGGDSEKKTEPNNAMVPIPTAVTESACAASAPSVSMAHLERWAE